MGLANPSKSPENRLIFQIPSPRSPRLGRPTPSRYNKATLGAHAPRPAGSGENSWLSSGFPHQPISWSRRWSERSSPVVLRTWDRECRTDCSSTEETKAHRSPPAATSRRRKQRFLSAGARIGPGGGGGGAISGAAERKQRNALDWLATQ